MRLPEHAEHGVVDPADNSRPGPRGRLERRVFSALLIGLIALAVAPMHEPSGTRALFVSRAQPQHNSIQGGIWAPDPPAACGDFKKYVAVVYGTQGDDVLYGGNHPQIIMGLDGNDTIYGGNSGDCLVGGSGADHLLGGNSKDILLGGPGNDYLDGGNAKDYLDGEDDADDCDGGNGKDDVVNCAPAAIAPLALSDNSVGDQTPPTPSPTADDQSADTDEPSTSLAQPSATPSLTGTDSGASSAPDVPSTPEATP